MAIFQDSFFDSVKVTTGSYVGTGSGGVTLNFDFEPKLIIVNGLRNGNNTGGVIVASKGAGLVTGDGSSTDLSRRAWVSWSVNSVTVSGETYFNPNQSGLTYHYVAIG